MTKIKMKRKIIMWQNYMY